MSFGETVAAIRAQGGLVYLPHPFDRMHAIPEPATLHRHLAEIDVFEVYNARLLFEALQRRGAPLRAQVQPHARRRIGRARPRRRRHRGRPHAPLQRPGGVPRLAPRRGGAPPPEVARLPPGPEVGGAGQGARPLAEGGEQAPARAARAPRTGPRAGRACVAARRVAAGLSLRTSAVTSTMPAAHASATSSCVSAEPMPRPW